MKELMDEIIAIRISKNISHWSTTQLSIIVKRFLLILTVLTLCVKIAAA